MSKIIAYHGSKTRFDQVGVDHSHGKTSNIGLYLSDSKDIARTYAGRSGYVYEVELALNNPMVIDFEGANWDSFDYEGTATSYIIVDAEGNDLEWFSNLPDAEFAESDFDEPVKIVTDIDPDKTWSTDDIARHAKSEGYDSVIIENVIDSVDRSVREPSTVYVVFDNECIVGTRLVSESLSESFIGFVKSLDRGWNKSLIKAIVDGYEVIFDSSQIKSATDNNGNYNSQLRNIFESVQSTITLYRGMTQQFNPLYDLSKSDAPIGYSTWTDNPELARQYAGPNGYVYKIELPLNEMGDEYLNEDGDRVLFFNNEKKAGLHGVNGNEYLVYTDHELYDPNAITLTESIILTESTGEYSDVTLYHGTNADFDSFDVSKAGLIKNSDWGSQQLR